MGQAQRITGPASLRNKRRALAGPGPGPAPYTARVSPEVPKLSEKQVTCQEKVQDQC